MSPPAYTAEPFVLYRHATLIDVVAGKAVPDMAILTRGERIVRIAPSRDLAGPPGAALVEASGLFVAPGLINSHVHLATPPERPLAEANLRRALFGGVTTVRDMADDLRQVGDLARAARVGEIPSPDIYYAALMAGPRFFDDPRTHATTAGAIAGEVPWMRAVTASTDLTRAVAEAKGTGATAIKIYADLPAPLVVAITHEAHRQGLKVWAHAAVFPARPS
ncbi:MAG TPA: amidohydrolase family protein, partial [Caulobacteraceae bacterium]